MHNLEKKIWAELEKIELAEKARTDGGNTDVFYDNVHMAYLLSKTIYYLNKIKEHAPQEMRHEKPVMPHPEREGMDAGNPKSTIF